jgi:hypothetical protein
MAANSNFDAISAATQRYYAHRKFEDAVFDGIPTFKYLKSRGGVTVDWPGGEKIVEPLMEDDNSTIQAQSAYTEIDTTPQDGLGAAEFQPKLYTGSVVMSHVDQWKNSGPDAVINIWKAKVEQCKNSFQVRLNEDLFNDGTDPLEIVGLALAIDSAGTYGNILRTSNTFWQSYEEGTAGVLSEDDMRTALRTMTRNKAKFSDYLIVTTLALFNKYESLITPSLRFTDNRLGDLGIPNLQFMGVPMIWDEDCTSGVMYFLHIPSFFLRVNPKANFTMSDKRQPEKQLVDVMSVAWHGALTTNNCRMSGKLTGRTAA